jgi:outer membrane receptor for ferrienterochelin and colicin
MKVIYIFLALFLITFSVFAQEDSYIQGYIKGKDGAGNVEPLFGANIYWLDTLLGTTADENGYFKLHKPKDHNHIVASFIGYATDTLFVKGLEEVNLLLTGAETLEDVEIVYRQKSTEIDFLDSRKVEVISGKELLKAACCNLSESFETNPSVDVSYTDAVTGTRQIQMLGLAGPNIQITRENMPDIRGLSSIYGLTYIPGPWIEGIHVIKGTGSVVNGFESIAGQINVNLQKPEYMDRLLLNGYVSQGGRIEANANVRVDVHEDLSTALLIHGSTNRIKHDRNEDGFLDMPLSNQGILLNRWELRKDNGLHFEVGIKGTWIEKTGGTVLFDPESDRGTTNAWGMGITTNRFEGWTKIGKVNIEKPWRSFGIQLSGAVHDQDSYFGLTPYDAIQYSYYGNFLYQSIINNTNHKLLTGFSFQYDDYRETLDSLAFDRKEIVPGAFFEYTYNHIDRLTLVAGLRIDHHNLYGPFFTPRLHFRYALNNRSVLRVSGGRGLRTANIISENSGILASSRQFVFEGQEDNLPYGLKPEIAWNFGINYTQEFTLGYRDGFFSFDFYRTGFENQIVVDLDRNPQQVVFYNLNGQSYSNSFQAQVDYELVKRLDARIAYRWFDVKTSYDGDLRLKPLVSRHRFFINLAYESRKHWKVDYTLNWQGRKRLPDTFSNPELYQLSGFSPAFVGMNVQVSKTWFEKLNIYVGVENLLDYTQKDPILASDDPFGPYFDSSMAWGPVFGRNIYAGIRYHLK